MLPKGIGTHRIATGVPFYSCRTVCRRHFYNRKFVRNNRITIRSSVCVRFFGGSPVGNYPFCESEQVFTLVPTVDHPITDSSLLHSRGSSHDGGKFSEDPPVDTKQLGPCPLPHRAICPLAIPKKSRNAEQLRHLCKIGSQTGRLLVQFLVLRPGRVERGIVVIRVEDSRQVRFLCNPFEINPCFIKASP